MRMEKNESGAKEGMDPSLLQEAAELFALTGGYRKPGGDPDLRKAVWICPADSKGKDGGHDL
jgi:hypothetical protein